MKARQLLRILAVASAAAACGGGETIETPPALPIGGMYEVKGETIAGTTGDKRAIAGRIVIAESADGSGYTATFNLTTTYPGAEEALPAEVIGTGQGSIEGRSLSGSAQTQLVMATVPGVDPGFAYVPRMVGTRIVSKSSARVAADGSVQIEIENQAAPGETYTPTRTLLSGFRVSSADVLEDVAASR